MHGRDSPTPGQPDGHAGFQPAPITLPGHPADVAQVTSLPHQLKAQIGRKPDFMEGRCGDERIVGSMDHKPRKSDPRDQGQGTAAGIRGIRGRALLRV